MRYTSWVTFLFALATIGSPQAGEAFSAPTRPDTSSLVEQALKITASFGIDSAEAKVAWDTVEEVDSSDNSAAYNKASLDEECDITVSETTQTCQDYAMFLDELVRIRDALPDRNSKKANLVQAIKSVKLTPPQAAPAKLSPELTEALRVATEATEKHGVSSTEAKLAWETYEEVASAGLENAMSSVSLDDECQLESGQEACEAIEEMDRVMAILLALSSNK